MSIPNSIPEKRHRAARVIAANARGSDDVAELLDMLGLTAAEGRFPPAPDAGAPPIPAPRHPSEAERGLATTLLSAVTHSHR
jgi:hypothetical protein